MQNYIPDQKLKILEKQYADKSSVFDVDKNATIQEKLLAYQANIEQKCTKEFEQKIKEFRENELEKIRVEERDRLRSDLLNSKQELERMYKARYESLSEKERNFDEILKQKHDIEQRETFMQRQHILNELNLLRDKEVEFKRHCDLHAKEIESDLLKMKNVEDQLKKREFELKLFENNFEQKLCNEREKIKFDLGNSVQYTFGIPFP
jgi:oral-facial-digital syndrome 1 protein